MSHHARPPGVTLANWDLGGEPSAWAYLHAGELLASVEIPCARRPAKLDRPRWPRSGGSRSSRE